MQRGSAVEKINVTRTMPFYNPSVEMSRAGRSHIQIAGHPKIKIVTLN